MSLLKSATTLTAAAAAVDERETLGSFVMILQQ